MKHKLKTACWQEYAADNIYMQTKYLHVLLQIWFICFLYI